jgi:6-phosphogluconolactonase (cycloisomerase 2 family)
MANGSLSIGGEYRLSDSGGQIRAPAAIKIHPSGKTLAVSDRFVDRIELFRIERGESDDSIPLLTTEGVFPCMGKTPPGHRIQSRWITAVDRQSRFR